MMEWKLTRYSLGEQPDGMQQGKVHFQDTELRGSSAGLSF